VEKEFRYSPRVLFREGDKVHISKGPYYEALSGTTYNMGVKGLHIFSHLDDDGNVWVKSLRGGLHLVYMGEDKISEATGTHMRSHKLRKIRKK